MVQISHRLEWGIALNEVRAFNNDVGFAERDLRLTHRLDSQKRQAPYPLVQSGKDFACGIESAHFQLHPQFLRKGFGKCNGYALWLAIRATLSEHGVTKVDRSVHDATWSQVIEYRGGDGGHRDLLKGVYQIGKVYQTIKRFSSAPRARFAR
ncbi:hypothetical protein D3C80_1234370 [compost metagenome]